MSRNGRLLERLKLRHLCRTSLMQTAELESRLNPCKKVQTVEKCAARRNLFQLEFETPMMPQVRIKFAKACRKEEGKGDDCNPIKMAVFSLWAFNLQLACIALLVDPASHTTCNEWQFDIKWCTLALANTTFSMEPQQDLFGKLKPTGIQTSPFPLVNIRLSLNRHF